MTIEERRNNKRVIQGLEHISRTAKRIYGAIFPYLHSEEDKIVSNFYKALDKMIERRNENA